ncbi:60S ribosomal protein L7a, putative [Leishmania tarentolae]|uniref:60S ribosomal protein L7a, putative n=1 Tax=Leishmania tarentolae TaxID=5689 RepID=A0A640K9U3_LEITA|nr:60S ribosomal protein L7a, putative [Leishmania tarentolae]
MAAASTPALRACFLRSSARDRRDSCRPPHWRRITSERDRKRAFTERIRFFSVASSSAFTSVIATHVAVFRPIASPRRAMSFTMAYGILFARHRFGIHNTSSTGSTLFAITTMRACFFSIARVTSCSPVTTAKGALVDTVFFGSFFFSSATLCRRSRRALRVSGAYFLISFSTSFRLVRSSTFVNWFSAGGTFRRRCSTRFLRCIVTNVGHRMKRDRSRAYGTSWPIPKFFGRAVKCDTAAGFLYGDAAFAGCAAFFTSLPGMGVYCSS